MFKSVFPQVRTKVSSRDPTDTPFERFIEMRKKLSLLGFIMEAFQKVDTFDPYKDENDDQGDDDKKTDELNDLLDDIQMEWFKYGGNFIDDLEKASFIMGQGPPRGSSSKKVNAKPSFPHASLSKYSHEVFMVEFKKKVLCDLNMLVAQSEEVVPNPGKV